MIKQLHYFKSWLLLMLCMVVGVGSAMAETKSVDITPSQALNDGGVDPITIVCAKGDGTSNPAISSGQLRLYQAGSGKTTGNTITFSSDKPITSIVFTFANSMTASNGSFSEGTYDSSTSTWTGNTNSVTLTVTGTTSGTRIYITALKVYYEDSSVPSDTRTSTAVTIDASGITNTNVFNGTAAGSLSATVKAGETTVDGASVTWSSDDTGVATIDATGAVTLVGAGSTVITASYAGDETNYKPSSDTYTLTVTNADPSAVWVKVDLADLKASDVFVIVGNNGSNYALSNDKGTGSAPSAVAVTVDGNNLTGTVADNIKWKISGNATDGYTFYPNGSTDTWLYCTNSNNGVRVGTNDNKTFEIKDDYLYNKGTSRYIGVYNSEDWRCYTSINSNIKDQSFAFYKKPSSSTKEDAGLVYATTSYEVNLGESFTAPELTNPNNLTVTYASTNTDVATVEASTGAVTLVGAGSTVITASFAGDDTYEAGSASYTLTVVDPNAPGTENNPYTVTQALAADPATGVYVTGTISEITEVSTEYNNATYKISDGTNEMTIYRGKYLNNTDFTSTDQIDVDDVVTVYGNLTVYNSANQMAQGNYIVSIEKAPVAPLSTITLSGNYPTEFSIGDEFNHEGMVVTATYADESTKDVTSKATFSGYDMNTLGQQTVTVTYTEGEEEHQKTATATYTITVNERPTHTVKWVVNDELVHTADFGEGQPIVFPTTPGDIYGKTFVGWMEDKIEGTTDVAPRLVSSATMGETAITYYAVFATAQGTGGAPSLTKMVSGDTFTDGDKVVIVADVDETTSYGLYQQTISNSYVMNFVFDNSVTTIADDDKNYLTVSSGSDGKWKLGDDTNGYLYNSSSNNLAVSTENATEWTLEDNEDGTFSLMGARYLSCRIDLSGDNANRWRMAGSSPSGVYDLAIYKFVDGNTSYSGYCTTVPEAVEVTITSAGAASFSSTKALDFSNVEGLKAYKATSKSDSYVHLDEVEQVPAGAGVIVKGAEGLYFVPVVTGDVAALDGNLLVGTAEAEYTVGDDYGKVFKYVKRTSDGVVGFQKAKADWTCQVGHAYLMFSKVQAREFIGIFDDDVVTGISGASLNDNGQMINDNDAPAYNLAGQKVGKGYKGIVIKNGKKVVIK